MVGNPGVDTGFTATKIGISGASKPLTVITTHLAAPLYVGCRSDQLDNLLTSAASGGNIPGKLAFDEIKFRFPDDI